MSDQARESAYALTLDRLCALDFRDQLEISLHVGSLATTREPEAIERLRQKIVVILRNKEPT